MLGQSASQKAALWLSGFADALSHGGAEEVRPLAYFGSFGSELDSRIRNAAARA